MVRIYIMVFASGGRAAVQCGVSSFQATKLFFFFLGALQRNEFVVVTRNAAKAK